MTAPVLAFGLGYSQAEKDRLQSRYAAALRYLLDHPDNALEVNGNVMKGLARHGLVTATIPRTVTPAGQAWAAAYDGPIAPCDDILVSYVTRSRKRPGRYQNPVITSILNQIASAPHLWLFVHRPALDKLAPRPFWLLSWLSAHRDTRTVDAIASAVGWSAEAVAIALRAIRDAGYVVDIVGESAAD